MLSWGCTGSLREGRQLCEALQALSWGARVAEATQHCPRREPRQNKSVTHAVVSHHTTLHG